MPVTMSEAAGAAQGRQMPWDSSDHDLHPAIPSLQVGETNSKTQEGDELSNGARPCAAGARRRGRQGQTGVWGASQGAQERPPRP